jgi:mono/diheme cytochrome c family protein
MWATNLRITGVVLGTILFYTVLANSIPQVQSEVPEEIELSEDATAEEIATIGEQLYFGAGGCAACHGTGARAPNLLTDEGGTGTIGSRCGMRVQGQSCRDYLLASMIEPNVYVVDGYQPIMPDMRSMLSMPQIWAIIAFMESQGGEISVTSADLAAPDGAAGPAATAPAAGGAAADPSLLEPVALLRANQCLACHELAGEGAPLGPSFDDIGARLDAARIRTAILDPAAQVSPGYEALVGVMPATFGSSLTAAQLEAIVLYLAERR